jgi:hypothetical protein
MILMSDQVTNAPQLRMGRVNEILSEGIFVRVDHAPWKFFGWTICAILWQQHIANVVSVVLV